MQDIKKYILEPGFFRLDGGAMFGIIPKPLWNKVAPADELNRIDLSLRLYLLQTKDRLILVDTGIGDYHGDKFDQRFAVEGGDSPLEKALEEAGHKSDEVTDLVISHLHFDHVGGIGKMVSGEMVPVLPKARCHLHQDHYQYALNPTDRDSGSFHKSNFEPIIAFYRNQGLLRMHQGEEGELMNLNEEQSLRFKCSHGHTPFLMHPYDNEYIYLADLIPTSNHISIPWVMGYDIAPGETTRNKKEFLDFIIDKGLKIIFEHDPLYYAATVIINDKKQYSFGERFARPAPRSLKAFPL